MKLLNLKITALMILIFICLTLKGDFNVTAGEVNSDCKVKILIFGISGTLGEALAKELMKDDKFDIYGTYYENRPELLQDKTFQFDMGNPEELEIILTQIKPDVTVSAIRGDFDKQLIFHEKLAGYLKKNNGKLYFCSTANVFDEDPSKPHYEDDICSSITDYGLFKIECEKLLKGILEDNLSTVRFSQIWGKDSPRMKTLLEKLENKEIIEAYTNVYMNRATDTMLAKQMHYLIKNNITGTFHLGTEDLMSDMDFISALVEKLGYKDVKIEEIAMEDKYYLAVLSKENIFPEDLRFNNIDVIEELTGK